MVGADSVVRFEPTAGGHLVEEPAGGGSLLWYTVQMATPEESLYLVGHTAPDFGGPTTSMLKLSLEENGDGCVLRVSDSLVGTSPNRISSPCAAAGRSCLVAV